MKKYGFYISLILFFTLFISSCNNLFGKKSGYEEESQIITLSGSFEINTARSAYPSVPSTIYYTVTATQTNPSVTPSPVIEGLVTETNTSATFTIKLPASGTGITYTLTAKAWKNRNGSDYSDLMFEGTINDVVVKDSSPSKNDILFTMIPCFAQDNGSGTGKGTVKLPVRLDSAGIVTGAVAKWTVGTGASAVVKTQELQLNQTSQSTYFTMLTAEELASGTSEVDAGIYDVDFYFYRGTDEAFTKRLAYMCKETVVVNSNLETNKWQNTNYTSSKAFSTISSVLTLYITGDLINSYENSTRYVKADGNNNGAGSFYEPFASIKKALAVLNSMNDEKKDATINYSVVVLSDLLDSSDGSYDSLENYAFLNIDSSRTFNVSFKSYGFETQPYKININRDSTKNGRGIYIGENANVTLQDIQITGGCTDQNGAGVFLSSGGTLNIAGSVIIDGNTKTDGSTKNNLYLSKNSSEDQKIINVIGDIEGSKIGVKCENESDITSAVPMNITSNFKTHNISNPSDIFTSDSGYLVGLSSDSTEAVLAASSYSVQIQMNEDYEIRCLKSKILNPASCDESGRTVTFYLYNKTTGEDLTEQAAWNISAKYTGVPIPENYVNTLANQIIFENTIGFGKYQIWAGAQIGDVSVGITHGIEVMEMTKATDFTDGIPPANTVLAVGSQSDLDKIREWVEPQNLTKVNIVLESSLELTGFVPIRGVKQGSYTGSTINFDGNGNTITINSFGGTSDFQCVFYNMDGNSEIKNVILDGESIFSKSGAPLAYEFDGNLINCINRININGNKKAVAGLVYSPHPSARKIVNCRNEGNITNASTAAGIAYTTNTMTGTVIENCVNSGTLEGSDAAGIIYSAKGSRVINCINSGTIKVLRLGGGITGTSYRLSTTEGYIRNCRNSGDIIIENTGTITGIGGIAGTVGYDWGSTIGYDIQNCINTGKIQYSGEINSSTKIGEIVGCIVPDGVNVIYTTEIITNNYYLQKSDSTLIGIGATLEDDSAKTAIFTCDGISSSVASPITVGAVTSTDVVRLLNAWIATQSDPSAYGEWVYDENGLPKMAWEE